MPSSASEDGDSKRRSSSHKSKNDLFADDPWNALCVLGLRVYSLSKDVKVTVVKSEAGS